MTLYTFNNWQDGNQNMSRTITLSSDMTLTAYYVEAITDVMLTVNAAAGGAVSQSGTFQLTIGVTYQFQAIPDVNSNFDHWDLGGNNKGSSTMLLLTITPEMDGQTLTALFTAQPPQQITITVAVNGSGTTDIAPGPQTFNVGDQITITATPPTGVAFTGWKLNRTAYSTDNPLVFNVALTMNGATLTAEFSDATGTISYIPLLILVALTGAAVL